MNNNLVNRALGFMLLFTNLLLNQLNAQVKVERGDFADDLFYYEITSSSTVKVVNIRRDKDIIDCEIPQNVTNEGKTYQVTSLSQVFQDCSELKSVTLPNSILVIGTASFFLCPKLTNITIPNSVTVIEDNAITECNGLISIEIPNSVTSIGKSAFFGCKGLRSIKLSENITDIKQTTFWECTSLLSVDIPNNVKSIEDYAFGNCSSLQSIKLNDRLSKIGNYAFQNCINLSFVQIPGNVEKIGNLAFFKCTSLSNLIISNSVTTIGIAAFSGCSSLNSVEIPNSVTTIEDEGFRNCSKLNSVKLSENLTTIARSTFNGCSSLKSIKIPDKVTSFGQWAFSNCTNLSSITIPDNVTDLGDHTFMNCSSLTQITLPPNITAIGGQTFLGCAGLDSIKIPKMVKLIDYHAFVDCSSLEAIDIPESVTSIQNLAFAGCTNLKRIHVNNSTPPAIMENTFEDVDKANCTVYIPKGALSAYKGHKYWKEFKYENDNPGIVSFVITYELENLSVKPVIQLVPATTKLEVTLIPDDGFELPDEITVCMGEKILTVQKGYTYEKVTGKLIIQTVIGPVKITAIGVESGVEPIIPSAMDEIIINSGNTYIDTDKTQKKFNGTIGLIGTDRYLKKVTIDASDPISVVFYRITVGSGNISSTETTSFVTNNTDVVIKLQGENSLGKLVNNGTTTISRIDEASLVNTLVENNGIFIDQTASITKVEGPASLDITAPEDNEVVPGTTTTLTASTTTGTDYAVTFAWEEQQPDGSWKQTGTPNTYTPTRSGLRADGIMIMDELKIKASESGKYRCVIMNKVGTVSTTLTTQPATVTVNSTVGNAVIDNRKIVIVRDGVLYIQVLVSESVQIVNYNGIIVRSLHLPAGESRVDGLQHGFYIIRFGDKQTVKVTVR